MKQLQIKAIFYKQLKLKIVIAYTKTWSIKQFYHAIFIV